MDPIAKLDNLTIRARSSDGAIIATLSKHRRVTVKPAKPGALERYLAEPDAMATQLARTLDQLWSTHRSTVDKLLVEAGSRPVDGKHWDVRARRYHAGVQSMRLTGMSPGRNLRFTSTNLAEFSIKVRPGSMANLTEQQLVTEINGALQAMQADRRNQLTELKNSHLNLGVTATATSTHALAQMLKEQKS